MRVLIVDPEPTRGPALMETLRTGGAEVTVAPSGSFALTMLERDRHDVVLSRARMDDMDGHELCAILKADPGTRDVRFVLVATPDEAPADVTTAAGVDLVLPPAMTGSAIVPLILRLVQANRAATAPAVAAPPAPAPATPEPETPSVPRIRPEPAPPPQAEPPKRYVSAIAAAAAAPWSKESEPAVAMPAEAPVPGIAPPDAAPATARPVDARLASGAPPAPASPGPRPAAAAPQPAATSPRPAATPPRPGATPVKPAAAAGKSTAGAPARPQSAPVKPAAAPAKPAAATARPGTGPARPASPPPRPPAPRAPAVVDLNAIPSGTFQGTLEVLDLADLTQAIAGGGKSGRLILALPQGGGVLLFDKGRVVHAEYRNTVGEEAFGALLAASHGDGAGRFCFLPTPAGQAAGTPHTIDKTVDRLLLSSATAIDEKR
jgi:CheY-like chemotaxis protein